MEIGDRRSPATVVPLNTYDAKKAVATDDLAPHSAPDLESAHDTSVNRPRTWSFPFFPSLSRNGSVSETSTTMSPTITGESPVSPGTDGSGLVNSGPLLSLENEDDARYLKLVTQKLILRAASDDPEAGGRAMFVVAGNHLPGPDWNYDKLVRAITQIMDDKVEDEYVMVLVASCVKYRPGWLWLYRSYRGLQRRYKKNLKKLYVVHPARWVRMTFDLLEKFRVSPKFFKKITYVESLTELAEHVPIDGMPISEPVIGYDLSMSIAPAIASRVHSRLTRTLQFATPLDKLLPEPTLELPLVIKYTTEYMLANGMEEEGLFRKSAALVDIEKCRNLLNEAVEVDFDDVEYGVHVAAQLLKRFLRELPEPVIPVSLYDEMGKLHDYDNDDDRVVYCQKHLFHLLPQSVVTLFSQIFPFLHTVTTMSDVNLMTSRNLAIVFAPNFVNSDDALKDMDMCSMVTEGKPMTNDAGGVGTFVRCLIEHPEAFDAIRQTAEEQDRERAEKAGRPTVRKVAERTATVEPATGIKQGNATPLTHAQAMPNLADLLPSSMKISTARLKDNEMGQLQKAWPSAEVEPVSSQIRTSSTSPLHSPTLVSENPLQAAMLVVDDPATLDPGSILRRDSEFEVNGTDMPDGHHSSSDERVAQTCPSENGGSAKKRSEGNSKLGLKQHKVWPEPVVAKTGFAAEITEVRSVWPNNEE